MDVGQEKPGDGPAYPIRARMFSATSGVRAFGHVRACSHSNRAAKSARVLSVEITTRFAVSCLPRDILIRAAPVPPPGASMPPADDVPHADDLLTLAQLRALGSSVRGLAFEVIAAEGPCSVAVVAEQTGRRATTLYRHVKILEEVGLIEAHSVVAKGRRKETQWHAPRTFLRACKANPSPARRRAIADNVASGLREAERLFRASVVDGEAKITTLERDTHAGFGYAWLTPEELKQLNRSLETLYQLLHRKKRRPGTTWVGFTAVVYPGPKSADQSGSPNEPGDDNAVGGSEPRSGRRSGQRSENRSASDAD
ncbi:MAG: ArsR family transcriptional regulator [Phycisphaerales bacterium]|nr:MAG: ArsR family transcriptional regulator [Phycisphaerales bacterium]